MRLSRLSLAQALAVLLLAGSHPALAERLLPHESQRREQLVQAIESLDLESKAIESRALQSRAACLSRWIQSACLEAARQQKARDERALLMASETLAESVRQIDARARNRAREARQEELHAR
jgi:hypothetical protein